MALSGQQLADGSLSTSLVLCDVNLDDTRPNREGKITRFMERRGRNEDEPSTSSDSTKSMIDITFRMKENEMFGDVKVFSFNLILSMDFLLKLSSFLQPEDSLASEDLQNAIIEQREYESTSAARRRKSSFSGANAKQKEVEKKAEFAIYIQEYDVILVEKMDDINCLALILNVSYFLFT
jgi:vacuolar protein sorting-associated protein 13A/C